jgi:predicted thioredoxin/glutaredoxin
MVGMIDCKPMHRAGTDSKKGELAACLYTREGCGLCEQLVERLGEAGLLRRLDLRMVDVDSDHGLKKLYGLRLPVLEVAGELIFEGQPDPLVLVPAVRAALEGAS